MLRMDRGEGTLRLPRDFERERVVEGELLQLVEAPRRPAVAGLEVDLQEDQAVGGVERAQLGDPLRGLPVGRAAILADDDPTVGDESIRWHCEVLRSRSTPHAPRRIVHGVVARTLPATIGAAQVANPIADRNAAGMRANTDEDQPALVPRLRAVLVGCRCVLGENEIASVRVEQILRPHGSCRLDLLWSPVPDEDCLAPPDHRGALGGWDRRQIDFSRRKRLCRGVWVHLFEKGPKRSGHADRRKGSGRHEQEVAARRLLHIAFSNPSPVGNMVRNRRAAIGCGNADGSVLVRC